MILQTPRELLKPHRMMLLGLLVCLIIETAFFSGIPLCFKLIIDSALSVERDRSTLKLVILILLVLAVLASLVGLMRNFVAASLVGKIVADLRAKMFAHLQGLSLGYFKRVPAGEVLTKFSGDLNAVEQGLMHTISWAILPSLDILFNVVLLFLLDWRLALVAMLVWPVTLLGPRLLAPRASKASNEQKEEEARLLADVHENLAAQETIKALGLQKTSRADFERCNTQVANATRRLFLLGSMVERSALIGIILLQVIVLGLGSWMAYEGSLSLGSLVAFQTLFTALANSLTYVGQWLPTLLQSRSSIERINSFLREPTEVIEQVGAEPLPPFQRDIQFQDVSFSYTEGRSILERLSFTLCRGCSLAIVGGSGSGKSTILNLLLRFYDPSQGVVRIDDRDLRQVTLHSLRAQIGVVMQDSFLFNRSIRDNIRLGLETASNAEVEEAARQAEIHDFILSLPEGYDTAVGERGGRLSGGQRQRIALARVLLRKPAILILDEATSALDAETEAAINATLDRIRKERTVISITHRLNSIRAYDRILVLDQGRIAQLGSHEELVSQNDVYRYLWLRQNHLVSSASLTSIQQLLSSETDQREPKG